MDYFYNTFSGRFLLKLFLNKKVMKLSSYWLHSSSSKILIKPFIKKNNIDMTPFSGQKYKCYADFFARKKDVSFPETESDTLISPCDGLISVVPIGKDTEFKVKGSLYTLNDLIPDRNTAELFRDGLCMIFRLQSTDYHHFCYIDDCFHNKGHFIEGKLHSVQPVALQSVPVFRQNRRMWSIMDTEHFGHVAQIEVGAVLVGGIVHISENSYVKRGDDMGNFELCGSTIILLFENDIKKRLKLSDEIKTCLETQEECTVKMGCPVAALS